MIITLLMIGVFVIVPIIALGLAFLFGWIRNIYQSTSKLIMTIIAIAVSAIIVKLSVPAILSNNMQLLDGLLDENILAFLGSSTAADDAVMLISCLIMPLAFMVVFALISIIFMLLYLIPGRLLSNKAFAKRAAKTAALRQAVPNTNDSEAVDPSESAQDENGKEASKTNKICLKAGSVACSMISTFLVLACIALPFTYYSEAIISINDTGILEDETLKSVVDVAESVSSYPTNIVYKPFSSIVSASLDTFKTNRGVRVSAVDSVCETIVFVRTVASINTESLTPASCYSLADQLTQCDFLNSVASDLLVEIVQKWQNGEAFLGIEPLDLGSTELNETIYETLTDCEDIPTVFRLLGDMLALSNVMQPDGADRVDSLYQVLISANADSMDALSNVFQSDAISAAMPSAEAYGKLLDSVLTQVIVIKDNSSIDEIERNEILRKEAESLTVVIDMVNDPGAIQPNQLIDAVLDSRILTSTVIDITHNSTVKDPCGIADQLPPGFTENLSNILIEQGVTKDTELYNAFISLVSEN